MKAEFFQIGNAAVRLLDTSALTIKTGSEGQSSVTAYTRHTVSTGKCEVDAQYVIERLRAKYNLVVFDEDGSRREYRSTKNASKRITLVGFSDGESTTILFPRWAMFCEVVDGEQAKLKVAVTADGRGKTFTFPVDNVRAAEYLGSMAAY